MIAMGMQSIQRDEGSALLPDPLFFTVAALAARGGLQKGDRILAIYDVRGAGKTIRSLFDYGEVARMIQFGEPWTLVIAREVGGGQWRELRLSVPPMLASPLTLSTPPILAPCAKVAAP